MRISHEGIPNDLKCTSFCSSKMHMCLLMWLNAFLPAQLQQDRDGAELGQERMEDISSILVNPCLLLFCFSVFFVTIRYDAELRRKKIEALWIPSPWWSPVSLRKHILQHQSVCNVLPPHTLALSFTAQMHRCTDRNLWNGMHKSIRAEIEAVMSTSEALHMIRHWIRKRQHHDYRPWNGPQSQYLSTPLHEALSTKDTIAVTIALEVIVESALPLH